MDQGIEGKVLWLEGNFMPGPGQDKKGEPIQREIHIYELTNQSDVTKNEHFYTDFDKEPVKVVSSDSSGKFKVGLPPGAYSVFSKEENGLYASVQDGEGNLNPVTVEEGKYTSLTFKIDYKAVY